MVFQENKYGMNVRRRARSGASREEDRIAAVTSEYGEGLEENGEFLSRAKVEGMKPGLGDVPEEAAPPCL